uniref:SH3 domain-containing protein n=1 Tax=Chelydra serpentina TaxID=8475 RepID=A0A8C3SRV1_CHESE
MGRKLLLFFSFVFLKPLHCCKNISILRVVKYITSFKFCACRIPNKHIFSLRAGDMGCFCIRFSQDGKTLAAACAGRDGYPIILYEIPSGQYLREFYGHLNIVYDLCWSKDNEYLLTASSDGTVRMWKIETQATTSVRVFPHPSFVYTAKYHPVAEYLVVTGCYDSVIRVWNTKVKEIYGQLLQEFDGHKSFINTLCFDAEGLHMFSGDSSGLIIVWNTFVKGSSQHPVQHWGINKNSIFPFIGDQVAMYSDLSFTCPVRDVAFHPHEHMVSFCAFGQNQPILVYVYDYKVAQQEAEIVKDLNGSLASTTPRGPHILSNSSHISAQKDSTMSPADQFVSVARVSMRMQKVKQKLDSVMVCQIYLYFQANCKVLSYNAYILYSTSTYYKTSIYLALYDYTAHRSDELTIHRSDIIQVLYKDNDNWWFGSLANGQQGYFPANYVAGESKLLNINLPVEVVQLFPTLVEMFHSPIIQFHSKDLKEDCQLKQQSQVQTLNLPFGPSH